MDHIPLLDQCFRQRFETKLYVGELYDWKGFWEFPERHGWDSEYIDLGFNRGHAQILLTRPHAHRRPGDSVQDPKAFASLLQSWLYHAMLHEVLGFQFDLDDLYYQAGSGDKILTTKHLEPLIQRWRDTMQTLPSAEARKHIANAMKCTSSVNRLMTSLSDRIKKCTADFFASKSAGKLYHSMRILRPSTCFIGSVKDAKYCRKASSSRLAFLATLWNTQRGRST